MIGEINRLPWFLAWLGDPLSWAVAGVAMLGLAHWLWRRAFKAYTGKHRQTNT